MQILFHLLRTGALVCINLLQIWGRKEKNLLLQYEKVLKKNRI